MEKPNKIPIEFLYKCPRCGATFHAQLHRSPLIKFLFPNLPYRRFFCGSCLKAYYVRIDPKLKK